MRDQRPSATTLRVLIADDNGDTREMYALYLNMVGYSVDTAEDGHEAILKARALRPDLVVMDLQMPKLDGFEAALQIRRLPELGHVPIVAVTASAMVGDRDKILARGFDGYIAKPVTPETFVTQVESFVRDTRDPGAPPQ